MNKYIKIALIGAISLLFGAHVAWGQEPSDSLRNQVGLLHLQTFYDNGTKSSAIVSLQYLRRFENKTTIIGRLNYADRQAGNGIQAEAESYLVHSKKYYSFASLSVSNSLVFPELKAGYSLYRNFKSGWEGELGYRFLRAEKLNMHSATWSAGKYAGNFWLNLRGYLTLDEEKLHQSYRLTGRYYINDQLDYATLILATGTSPDDRSRNFQYNSFSSFISKSIAVGFKKSFGNQYEASVTGAWNNQKIGDDRYLNQYDIYLSIYRNF